jgi:hypothetical protein
MVVPKMLKSQMVEKMRVEVERLQGEARMLFFDRMMYEVNDSLTSILAITEVEPKDAIPRIKHYIHNINRSLNNAKGYQLVSKGEKKFNVTQVLRNLVEVVENNYRGAKLETLIYDLKAPGVGDQTRFEQLFLTLVVDILSRPGTDPEILIECRQKDEFAVVTLLKASFAFSEEAKDQVNRIVQEVADFKGRFQITQQEGGVEVAIRIPLQFSAVSLNVVSEKMPAAEKAPKK